MINKSLLNDWAARYWYPAALLAVTAGFFAGQLLSAIADALGTLPVLSGDPWVYMERYEDIRSGLMPYTEMEFEHFPLALVPIVLAGLVADFTSIPYWNTFVGVMMLVTFATTFAVKLIGDELGDQTVVGRFLLFTTPLLPLVLFRVDLLPVMCVGFAVWGWIASREGIGRSAAMAGILAKGWPVVFVVTEWWRGKRGKAVLLFTFTVAMVVALVLLPGFQSGRAFTGIHLETIVGSVILFIRGLSGANLGILSEAGALYIATEPWLVAANIALGGAFALWALRGLRAPFSWRRANVMAAALTMALMLASPLFSPQFLIWPVVFLAVAAGRRVALAFTLVSVVTIAYAAFWDHTALWWASLLLVRNVLFVALVFMLVRDAGRGLDRTA